jgi:hypothetical protein
VDFQKHHFQLQKIMSKMEFIHKMNVIQNKNATKLILNQNRVNQAVMNFEKGNIGVKDGTAIHRVSSALCVYFSPSLAVIFPLSALFASMLALLNLPFAISIDISSALSLSYAVLSGNSTALDISSAEVIISGQSNMPLNQTKAAKERIGRLQNARSKKREKESAEEFHLLFLYTFPLLWLSYFH